MSLLDKNELEPRSENEPKYNPNNATDRKIVRIVIWSCVILAILAAVLIVCYYMFMKL